MLRLKRRPVNREAVLYIGAENALVRFVDLLNRDNLDIRHDVVLTAEVEHFLRFRQATDERARQATPSEEQAEAGQVARLDSQRRWRITLTEDERLLEERYFFSLQLAKIAGALHVHTGNWYGGNVF